MSDNKLYYINLNDLQNKYNQNRINLDKNFILNSNPIATNYSVTQNIKSKYEFPFLYVSRSISHHFENFIPNNLAIKYHLFLPNITNYDILVLSNKQYDSFNP